MKDIIEFEHKGVTLSASRAILVQALAEHVGLEPAYAPLSAIPRIGERWTGEGGYYAGVMRGVDGPDYHLIVSDGAGNFKDIEWAPRPNDTAAIADCDGLKNTCALLASDAKYPAAAKCAEFSCEGHNDYYLPARRELSLCFANVRELFDTDDWYWSSTQYSAVSAWCQNFDGGGQSWRYKSYGSRVRAVRRVFIK
jgi:hypothetical protein